MDPDPELENDHYWAPERRRLRNKRAVMLLLMLVPTAVGLIFFLPNPHSDSVMSFPFVTLVWTAGFAYLFARSSPPESGVGGRIAAGLLVWLAVTGLNVVLLAGIAVAGCSRSF